MSALAQALADRYAARAKPFDMQTAVFDKIGYRPNCKVVADARDAGVPDSELPEPCGGCPQELFHVATEYDVLYGGAAGGGKTAALVADDLKDAVKYPGIRIAAFRRSFDELAESLLKQLATFGYAASLGARWNMTDKELRFPNGSLIRYRYVENALDASRRQGGEYNKLTFDERSLFAPGVCDLLIERIRSGSADVPVIGIRSGSNPGGPDHAGVKARFIDATDRGQITYIDENEFSVRFIPAKVEDNQHVDKGYIRRLDAIPDPARRAAMRDGDWDQFSGQFFTTWRHQRHVVPAFPLPTSWLRYAGIDWGHAAPWAVVWLAVDEDQRVWVYREVYETNVGEDEQAARILDREDGETLIARYADDAMWTGRGAAKSVADVYAETGCHITPAKKGERVTGWQRVHSYLADGPACLYHREQGWDTCPRLHVLEGAAPNLVRTLPALPHDKSKVEDVDTKAEDHAPDALRYVLINLAEPTINGWLRPEPATADHAAFNPTAGAPGWWQPQEADGWDSGHASWDPNAL